MSIIATYDPAAAAAGTDLASEVRLYIDDRDMSSVDSATALEKRSVIFSDPEIALFLRRFPDPMMAAAAALRTIANNRSLLVMRRVLGDTTVDYGTLRADLLRQADALQQQYEQTIGGFDAPADGVAEVAWTDFALREIVTGRVLRNGT